MQKNLLTILRCPVTHKGLSLLKKDKLAKVNEAIAAGKVKTLDGVPLEAPLAEEMLKELG